MSRRIAVLWIAGLALAGCADDISSTPGNGGTGGSAVTDGAGGSAGDTTTTGGAATGGAPDTGPGPGEPCDVFAQDCADPAAPKCAVDFSDPTELPSTCQPALGDDMFGELCERPDGTPGIDTCAPGLFCGFFGQPLSDPQTRQCLEDCNATSACGADRICFRLAGPAAPDARLYGVCADGCDPFSPSPCAVPLNKCVPGLAIAGDVGWTCVPAPADGAEGDACMADLDCGPLLACNPDTQACAPVCDAGHPCTAPATCVEGLSLLGLCVAPAM